MISAYHTQLVEHLAPFSDAVRMTSAGALTGRAAEFGGNRDCC